MSRSELAPPATVGFIGLGNMGYPMARNLCQAGFRVLGHDLNPAAMQRLADEAGAIKAGDLSRLGAEADAVITMLPEGSAVRAVLMAPGGVCSSLAAGRTVIDMSSCSPVDTRALSAELAAQEITLIDAPVSGGVIKAVEGSLAIMAGGEAGAIEAARPLLSVLGKVFVTGGSGTGHAMKAMNNFLSAATLAVTSEAVLAGRAFGLDPATMVDIINASTGRSNSSEHKFPAFILNEKFNSGFFLGLMAKDLRFARRLTETTGTPDSLLREVSRLYDAAENALGGRADNTALFSYLAAYREE